MNRQHSIHDIDSLILPFNHVSSHRFSQDSCTLVNFIIQIYSQSATICSFVKPSLTTYSTESSDFGNDEIHSV